MNERLERIEKIKPSGMKDEANRKDNKKEQKTKKI